MNDVVVVVTGAAPLAVEAVAAVPPSAIVLAADGGLDHALAAGLLPAALVGDLDSISPAGLAWAEANATIQRHSPDKDLTDTELALSTAVDLDPARLIMLSGGGDRLDHTLAAIGSLGHPALTSIPTIDAWWGAQHLRVVHGPGRAHLTEPVGTTLTLLAMHGACEGVTIDGVRWPLGGVVLAPLVGLGVSNVTVEPDVHVSVSTGVLTIFLIAPTPQEHP